jgi:hypothetical protein
MLTTPAPRVGALASSSHAPNCGYVGVVPSTGTVVVDVDVDVADFGAFGRPLPWAPAVAGTPRAIVPIRIAAARGSVRTAIPGYDAVVVVVVGAVVGAVLPDVVPSVVVVGAGAAFRSRTA